MRNYHIDGTVVGAMAMLLINLLLQELPRQRMSRTHKQLPPSNVAFALSPATHPLLWHSQSATPMSPIKYDLYFSY